ncbi:MAG: fluoride efflux transporter CrcB [Chloroflexota bacterium]|jgi:CrcB protein
MLQKMVLIALAGAVGTLARYGLSGLIQRVSGGDLPLGTLVVNILGCFLFGLVWALAEDRLLLEEQTRMVLLGGFMGAFTTFSTFVFDTGAMVREAQWLLATGNVLVQTGVGLAALYGGIVVGRLS